MGLNKVATYTLPVLAQPERVERHGHMVSENTAFDTVRRIECLCHRCRKLQPGDVNNCKIAGAFYDICKDTGCALILTRCPCFEQRV